MAPQFFRILLGLLALVLLSSRPGVAAPLAAPRVMENLGRGVVAIHQRDGNVFVSWRMLGTDPDDVKFNLYRAVGHGTPSKLNSQPLAGPTHFLDKSPQLSQESQYTVRPVIGGAEREPSAPFTLPAGAEAKPYLSVPLQVPAAEKAPDGTTYDYVAGDCSVGDLDGDGEYEMIVKWEANPKDNSFGGFTGEVFLDGYKLDGTRLWRINLGKNIRAGAHYTQLLVYDFDGDGRAEVVCKTADGTVDGKGKIIGNPRADHRNKWGYILKGPEFLTVFDGLTGAELATTEYIPSRYPHKENPSPDELKAMWGDGYGNRFDRFLACVAYLDGVHPSLVMCRGYYTRSVLAAWDWREGKLTSRWVFDSDEGGSKNKKFAGQGNHNLSVADVDGDGKDEIVYGGMCIDDDGKGLWTTGLGHGDAMHVTDLDPDRPGLEVFRIQERFSDAGAHMLDAKTGEILWKKPSVSAGSDGEGPGRGVAFDVDPRTKGAESWVAGAGVAGMFDCKGNVIAPKSPATCNFAVWWDGDLLRELLDRTWIAKWNWRTSGLDRLLTAEGASSNNSTKATPCLSGDILGDWREEVVWRSSDNKELRIYTTTIPTEYRFPTLMHDPQYRLAVAWQNVSYNQPPHPGFYLGEGMAKPPRPNITTTVQTKRPPVPLAQEARPTAPAGAPPAAVQEHLRAMAARRAEEEARAKIVQFKGQPRALLVIKSPGTPAQLARANAVTRNETVVAAELARGGRAVWQKQVVAQQLPWPTPGEIEGGEVEAAELLARYRAAGDAYPELKPELALETTAVSGVVARLEAAKVKEQFELRFAALTEQTYDPQEEYKLTDLEALIADGEQLSRALPEKKGAIEAALTPFRLHLQNVRAGRKFVNGAWLGAQELALAAQAQRLQDEPMPGTVATDAELLRTLKPLGTGLAALALGGLVLAFPRKTRWVGLALFIGVAGGTTAWMLMAQKTEPGKAAGEASDEAEQTKKGVRLLVLGAHPEAITSGDDLSLSAEELNAFLHHGLRIDRSTATENSLQRTGLSAEVRPGRVVLREEVRHGQRQGVLRYELKAVEGRLVAESLHLGGAPILGPLRGLLWERLSGALRETLRPGVEGLRVQSLQQDTVELSPAPTP